MSPTIENEQNTTIRPWGPLGPGNAWHPGVVDGYARLVPPFRPRGRVLGVEEVATTMTALETGYPKAFDMLSSCIYFGLIPARRGLVYNRVTGKRAFRLDLWRTYLPDLDELIAPTSPSCEPKLVITVDDDGEIIRHGPLTEEQFANESIVIDGKPPPTKQAHSRVMERCEVQEQTEQRDTLPVVTITDVLPEVRPTFDDEAAESEFDNTVLMVPISLVSDCLGQDSILDRIETVPFLPTIDDLKTHNPEAVGIYPSYMALFEAVDADGVCTGYGDVGFVKFFATAYLLGLASLCGRVQHNIEGSDSRDRQQPISSKIFSTMQRSSLFCKEFSYSGAVLKFLADRRSSRRKPIFKPKSHCLELHRYVIRWKEALGSKDLTVEKSANELITNLWYSGGPARAFTLPSIIRSNPDWLNRHCLNLFEAAFPQPYNDLIRYFGQIRTLNEEGLSGYRLDGSDFYTRRNFLAMHGDQHNLLKITASLTREFCRDDNNYTKVLNKVRELRRYEAFRPLITVEVLLLARCWACRLTRSIFAAMDCDTSVVAEMTLANVLDKAAIFLPQYWKAPNLLTLMFFGRESSQKDVEEFPAFVERLSSLLQSSASARTNESMSN